jgi:dolichol-phosphate mannosyltransferase
VVDRTPGLEMTEQAQSGTILGESETKPAVCLPEVRLPEAALAVELAVVVPTYNERGNIRPLVTALTHALAEIQWEVIFVDDHSPDGTAEVVREMAQTNPQVRVLERIGRRGLSSACIEGMLATAAPYIAVLDADLQHDERLLPRMLERIKAERLDIVIGTRQPDVNTGELSRRRIWLSRLGHRISRLVSPTEITDAMSGFFLIDRNLFSRVAPRLNGTGFKILVDLLASNDQPILIGEEPYEFRKRHWGESKLDFRVEAEYLYLIADKLLGRILPTRFVIFALVGSVGVIVHLAVLWVLYYQAKFSFLAAQAAGTFAAMTLNFLLDNGLTFHDTRLRGVRILSGLLTFYVACSVGALVNLSVANSLFRSHVAWWLAAICGLAVSSVWNYGVNAVFTWRRSQRQV